MTGQTAAACPETPIAAGRAGDETQIRALLDAYTRALHERNADAAVAVMAEDVVGFELAPPLRMPPEAMRDRDWHRAWFETWDGPITSTSRGLDVAVGGDVAYAFCLQHLTGTKVDGERVDLWFRATAGFRRGADGWRIAHLHNSVPIAMDGSGRALLDLQPD